MRLSTLFSLIGSGQLLVSRQAMNLFTPLYRVLWLSTAGEEGLLRFLAPGARGLGEIAAELQIDEVGHEALASWLQVGVALGELSRRGDGYALSSTLAHRLARPDHDPLLALLGEVAHLHGLLLVNAPVRLREGRPFTLDDQDGELVARSSRIVEPFIRDAVSSTVPLQGEVSLLEVGCGTGTHLHHAAALNPQLTALGLELQPEVADMARRSVDEAGLSDRIHVETGDILDRPAEPAWDIATLHQNIYYFPVPARVDLFRHLRGFLRPGGRLLITTACRGSSPLVCLLDLWGAATEGSGRLPDPDELVAQLTDAGFAEARARRIVPGETFFSFVGTNPQ